jgi:hypothetical protein
MRERRARVLRGTGAALLASVTAAGSHTLAGGFRPSVAALLVSLVFGSLLCIWLVGTRLTLRSTVLCVVAAQGVFHALFEFLGSGGASVTAESAHVHAAGDLSVSFSGGMGEHMSHWMLVAHLVAAAVTIVGLRLGSRGFARILGCARVRAARLLAILRLTPLPAPPRVRASASRAVPVLTGRGRGHPQVRRGPPLGLPIA